jgi:hypothetical protein
MAFAAGQTYRLPADQHPAWFANVLDEIARAHTRPVTIAIRTSDSRVVTGHLEGAGRAPFASVEVWKPNGWQGQIVTLACDEIEAFKLLADWPPRASGEAQG